MPDMGYVPPIQPFQLPGPAKINTDPGLIQGLAAGLPAGAEMGKNIQEAQALGIANQYAPQMAQLKALELQMKAKEQEAKAAKDKADAINGLGSLAPVLKLLPIKNAKELLSSHVRKLQSIYPDLPVDPQKITDDNIDEVESWAKGRPEIEKLNSPDALMTYDSHWISQMGETQRQQVADIHPVTPQEMFSQTATNKRTEFTAGQENLRKVNDEVKSYETTVRPYVDAHNSFKQMMKIASQAEKGGTNVDPWSFMNAYVHTLDPEFNGVLNAQTYKDLRITGSPIVASMPWGEKYLTTSKLDQADAMQMLQIAKQQDKLHTGRASDIRGVTQRLVGSLGGDQSLVHDFVTDKPITKVLKSGRTVVSTDGGVTWQLQQP